MNVRRVAGARTRQAVALGKGVLGVAKAAEVTFIAASVAYYAFLSLLPMLLLVFVVASTVAGDALANAVVATTGEFLTPSGERLVANAFEQAQGRAGTTLLGLVVLVWGVLKVFRALDIAFLRIYGSGVEESFLDQVKDALIALVGVGGGITAMLVVGAVLASANSNLVLDLLGVLFLPAVLMAVFLPLYYVFPDRPVKVHEVIPGTVFAAFGWMGLQALFQIYAGVAGHQAYGVLGGILLLVTWFYIAAVVLLLGATLNAVLAGVRAPSDRQVQHEGAQQKRTRMADRGDHEAEGRRHETEPQGAADISELERRVEELRADLDAFESDVSERTVEKPKLEYELKRYVRRQMRRGHARGWGPYLVLLYGTVLTLGAFYYLEGIYALAAMLILGLSTLGLYTLFVLVGVSLNLAGIPWRAYDSLRNRRE